MGAGIFLLLLGYFGTRKIEAEITTALSGMVTYDEIDVNLLQQKIHLENPVFDKKNKFISAEGVTISGISIYNYLINDKITIDNLILNSPEVVISPAETDTTKTAATSSFEEDISVGTLQILDGSIALKEKDTSLNSLFLKFDTFKLEDVAVNAETVEDKIPFNFSSFALQGDSLKLNMGELHYLTTGEISVENGAVSVEDTRIIPKYNKVDFQKHIPYEKDRFELQIDSIGLNNLTWEFVHDTLFIRNPLLTINGANLEVYRNKLMPDDTSIKPMYSELIRELPVKINFEEVKIENSAIVYEEKSHADRPPLEISFTGLDADIENIVNIGLKEEDFPATNIEVRAIFMEKAPVEVTWNFNSSNLQDQFNISGKMGNLPAPALNKAIKPAMNIKSEGEIESLAFNYSGNVNAATGDMRITYNNFKVIVLKKEGNEINKFLSAIANLFVNNEARSGDTVHKDLEVTRDKTKSFWNYLWLMVREGALKAFL